ncbi:hypothetical protein Lal_00036595 [Lupinus albus]|nr:hypothetical protein Lal_00036595 [Lupinus albus]
MKHECSWVVGLRVTWIITKVGLADTRITREVGLWDTFTFTEVRLAQPHIQREVGLGHRNFSTHGSVVGKFKPLVSVADTAAALQDTPTTLQNTIGHLAHTECMNFDWMSRSFKYDYLREPSKDVLRMRHVNMFDEESLLNDILQLTETHTFHLPHGECTITLEDVSLKIGVNVNDLPIAGPTYFDWNEICEELLGKVPRDEQDMRGCELKLTWLFDNFETLPLALHS